jgi:ATP-dependent protease ClpP protease subunit
VKDLESLPRLFIRGQIAPKDSMFSGETFSASDVRDFLRDNHEATDIVVEISSDGGYKTEGIEIFNLLKNSGKNVTTIAYKANSIATVIMLSGSTRLIVEHAQHVVHFARIDPADLGINSLTSEDLQRLADETERADSQILDIYCSVLGEDRRTELIAAMADERDLGAKGAVKLGFATGYYKKATKQKADVSDYHNILINEHLATLIQNKMANEKNDEKLNSLELLIKNGLKTIAKMVGKIKNEVMLTLSDGKQIYVAPLDPALPDDLNGASVFEVDDAGMATTTPVADGTYTLDNGSVLIVAAGVVTEVQQAVNTEQLKADLAAKEEALKAASAEIAALKAEAESNKVEMKKQFDSIQNAFNEFKKEVPGDKKKNEKDEEQPMDFSKMSTAQRVRAMSKERAKLNVNL